MQRRVYDTQAEYEWTELEHRPLSVRQAGIVLLCCVLGLIAVVVLA